jgi:hypothetical protein
MFAIDTLRGPPGGLRRTLVWMILAPLAIPVLGRRPDFRNFRNRLLPVGTKPGDRIASSKIPDYCL